MLRSTLFITGATGYVGRRLLESAAVGRRVVALVRDRRGLPRIDNVDYVEGELLDPASYEASLRSCEQVLHLAAVTGKARRRDYMLVNVDGTRALLTAAKRAGVTGFLHVSTIAVGFEDQTRYWYAHSKTEAEALVRASGIPHTIVRPTIIVGPDSPVVVGLAKLACAPVMPVFGAGEVEVQPVNVHDLARCLLALIDQQRFGGETLEVGGPEVVSVRELLARVRRAAGCGAPRVLRIPLRPIRGLLGLLEGPFFPVMPLTAGQLATFANSGTAAPDPRTDGFGGEMVGLDDSLRGLGSAIEQSDRRGVLEREAARLGRRLVGRSPDRYVLSKYVGFHLAHGAARLGVATRMDRLLLAASRVPGGLWLADAYAARFCKRSVLRSKLVLMLALLECSAPSARALDDVGRRGRLAAVCALASRGTIEALCVLAGTVVFLPLHGVSLLWPLRRRGAGS